MTTCAFVTGGCGAEPVRGEPADAASMAAAAAPLTRLAVWLSAAETTIDITRARTELGYAPVRTIDEGLEELRQP